MSTKIKTGSNIAFLAGGLCFFVSRFCVNYLSDFSRGFFDGMAATAFTISVILLIVNTIKTHKNINS